jgi:hypothetical protein
VPAPLESPARRKLVHFLQPNSFRQIDWFLQEIAEAQTLHVTKSMKDDVVGGFREAVESIERLCGINGARNGRRRDRRLSGLRCQRQPRRSSAMHSGRKFFYGCSAYHERGPAACANDADVPMLDADEIVLEALLDDVLDVDVLEAG